jgi:catechol 2,3-dioxygenase-like lactoylglutathione lyase family enzyme
MAILRIDHVQISYPPGGDAEIRRFYGELLGCHEVPKPEAMRVRGGMWFAEGLHLGVEPDMRPSQKAHVALIVDDFDAICARLVAAGCEFELALDQPDVRRGHTRDPFGNRIELVAAPAASI